MSALTMYSLNFFILTLDPSQEHPWQQATVRDPLSYDVPDLAKLIAAQLKPEPGRYLVSVKLEVAIASSADLPELIAPTPLEPGNAVRV